MSLLKQKREERAAIHAKVTELLKNPSSTETRSKVDTMLADIETLSADIARIEKADRLAAEISGTRSSTAVSAEPSADGAKEYRKAFFEYLRHGQPGNTHSKRGGADPESFRRLTEAQAAIEAAPVEQRDQLAGTQSITYTEGSVGGYFVPAGFVYDVEKATKYFAPLLDGSVIRTLETATGQVLPYPTSNDTQNAWTLVGEALQVSDQGTNVNYPTQGSAPTGQPGNVLLGHINFNAYKGTTGLVRVSLELLQDSAFPLEAFLTEAFAIRLGRGYEYYLTNGTGNNQPTGILPAIAASGAVPVTAAGSSANDGSSNTGANSIGYQDLVNLIHSVDPTYRRGAKFMLHDSTLRFLKTLLDKFGRPLWVPSMKEGEPDSLCGYPVVINQSFPQIAASETTVAFGDFQKFIARKVKGLQVLRLDERFADFGEVAYIGFSRIDSNYVFSGVPALNVLQQHS